MAPRFCRPSEKSEYVVFQLFIDFQGAYVGFTH